MCLIEEHTSWANRAELYISIFKEAVRRDHPPMVLWDYCKERRAIIQNAVPSPLFQNHGLTLHEATFGAQCQIYQFIW